MFIFNDVSYNSDCLNVAAIEHSPLKLVDLGLMPSRVITTT